MPQIAAGHIPRYSPRGNYSRLVRRPILVIVLSLLSTLLLRNKKLSYCWQTSRATHLYSMHFSRQAYMTVKSEMGRE